MHKTTRKLWEIQNKHGLDRVRLFGSASEAVGEGPVLYPGSFVDICASAVFRDVTYVDTDRRTPAFFSDTAGVREILASIGDAADSTFAFIHADYQESLDLPLQSFNLLVSLYAGFISEHCTRYLRPGGYLLANTSHGDVAMAALDPDFELAGVLTKGTSGYRLRTESLEGYLVPKTPIELSRDALHQRGRGVAYTKTAAAYLFRLTV